VCGSDGLLSRLSNGVASLLSYVPDSVRSFLGQSAHKELVEEAIGEAHNAQLQWQLKDIALSQEHRNRLGAYDAANHDDSIARAKAAFKATEEQEAARRRAAAVPPAGTTRPANNNKAKRDEL
jgi:hypothetical protein